MTETVTGELFRAAHHWAAETPEATAVSAPDGTLSFAELLDRTRSTAGALRAAGVRPGVAVGLCLDRSRLSLSGLLAVWWLGATAVPLALRDPADRTSFVLGDAGVRVLLADRPPAGALPRGVRLLAPDTAAAPVDAPVTPGPLSCAYVVYTSGTTGWPKGVEVSYRSLETFVSALGGIGLRSGGMGVNAVSPAFDGWLWCALLYLLHGQGMAILDATATGGDTGDDLTGQLVRTAARTVCLTPSLLAGCAGAVGTAEVVVVAGEVLPAGLAAQLAPGRRFINVYGPTETTIAATWADSGRGDDVLSIGRPLPGYVAHVLDETYRPVPAGQTGELYVGGPAVALGYRNTPDLTAARFVPDPSAGNGSRMYRTGDLVAVRPDGLLEYRGRTDGQVKVRGFRIELAELERAAAAATPLRAAAAFVLPSGDALGLAVVTPPGTDADGCTARIREHCTATLPPQMVPAVVEAVPVIPTTTSGKVDRAALAASAGSRGDRPGRPATTERQVLVRDIWATLLARPVDDIDANFFELGGHSLLAAQAVAALRERTRLRLSVRHLLAHPTVAGLARELDDLAGAAARASTPDTVPS